MTGKPQLSLVIAALTQALPAHGHNPATKGSIPDTAGSLQHWFQLPQEADYSIIWPGLCLPLAEPDYKREKKIF